MASPKLHRLNPVCQKCQKPTLISQLWCSATGTILCIGYCIACRVEVQEDTNLSSLVRKCVHLDNLLADCETETNPVATHAIRREPRW